MDQVDMIGYGKQFPVQMIGNDDALVCLYRIDISLQPLNVDRHQVGKWFIQQYKIRISAQYQAGFDQPFLSEGEMTERLVKVIRKFRKQACEPFQIAGKNIHHRFQGQLFRDKIRLGKKPDHLRVFISVENRHSIVPHIRILGRQGSV